MKFLQKFLFKKQNNLQRQKKTGSRRRFFKIGKGFLIDTKRIKERGNKKQCRFKDII
ncbi:MAG: hypothetical protein OXB88_03815 [Bacteriovoracales bacterium]|nr:hypothetical protein [Bacteriovoracales bacterium]